MSLNATEEIIEDIRHGKIVVIVDDEDRENEGDLLMAASCVRPEDINFMARFGRGLICLTLTRERCKQLRLPLMVGDAYASRSTNFTIAIEAAEGVTTGISAADRALTIRAAVKADAKPSDLVQPGHVFPLMAQPGGVLRRAGHTEAGCDLARLAGFEPAAVIVEILKEDGSMARRPDLEAFASEHGLKIGTIANLIHFRIQNEKTVERVADCFLPTEYGEFKLVAYRDSVQNDVHLAMIKGKISKDKPTLVRVHLQNPICDLTGSLREDCGWPLRNVLQRIAKEEAGVIVILCNQVEPPDLISQINSYKWQDNREDLPHKPNTKDLRTIGLGAQILSDLGVRKMRVLSAPKRIHAISGFGLEVVEYVN
ncbi:MAG: bifunctional 3,4-dihydroxy-2-butanone-4-phosphate synthase/GTP cyclohydrolase II [Gammaproteobacteria bacterium]|nr:bifunctional 3,4-dihydroxy-2-butanone-4-phosphate synthase/GTP cyclohydrolase II [Gammaproteobacteria bacterium]